MTDERMDEADVDQSVPAPAPDAFAAVLTLLALVTDPRAARQHLVAIRAATEAVEKSRAALATERAEFDKFSTGRAAELDAKANSLRDREVRVFRAEAGLAEREKVVAAFHRDQRDRELEHFPGGMSREPDRSGPPEDAHFQAAEDSGFVSVPAQPPVRRSMRRGQEV